MSTPYSPFSQEKGMFKLSKCARGLTPAALILLGTDCSGRVPILLCENQLEFHFNLIQEGSNTVSNFLCLPKTASLLFQGNSNFKYV